MIIRKSCHIGLILGLVVLSAGLAGCGRNGPLEEPTAYANREAEKNGEPKPAPNTQYTPLQKQSSFPLDPLLR